ncbi:hypothetical protein PAQ31011_02433 [Pandoraea aquatica]|uniref:Uncharacterized protein n=1 Tax=Pandoraea aquatica TaxID=2508290 RepID=A0A5E4V6V4_9BURK|nr:hypothetical protein PAQ31011_02433 [Pandoraea aquatica]
MGVRDSDYDSNKRSMDCICNRHAGHSSHVQLHLQLTCNIDKDIHEHA